MHVSQQQWEEKVWWGVQGGACNLVIWIEQILLSTQLWSFKVGTVKVGHVPFNMHVLLNAVCLSTTRCLYEVEQRYSTSGQSGAACHGAPSGTPSGLHATEATHWTGSMTLSPNMGNSAQAMGSPSPLPVCCPALQTLPVAAAEVMAKWEPTGCMLPLLGWIWPLLPVGQPWSRRSQWGCGFW